MQETSSKWIHLFMLDAINHGMIKYSRLLELFKVVLESILLICE